MLCDALDFMDSTAKSMFWGCQEERTESQRQASVTAPSCSLMQDELAELLSTHVDL